jgi:hypothetical protein
VILIFTCFSITHIKFLKKYTSKDFEIHKSDKIIDDIKFIITFIFLGNLEYNYTGIFG